MLAQFNLFCVSYPFATYTVVARNFLQSRGIAWLVAMLAQRQLPWGPITSLLGLPFSAYTGTCHERVALQSELYPILCLLLLAGHRLQML